MATALPLLRINTMIIANTYNNEVYAEHCGDSDRVELGVGAKSFPGNPPDFALTEIETTWPGLPIIADGNRVK